MEVIPQLTNQRNFAAWTGQQAPIGTQRIQGTKESKALNEPLLQRHQWGPCVLF